MPKDEEYPHEIASHIAGQTAQVYVQIDRAMAGRFKLLEDANLMEYFERHRVFEAKVDLRVATENLSQADKKIITKNFKSPHAVRPVGLPPGSQLDFNLGEILKGLSSEGQHTAMNNIINNQPPSLGERVAQGYQKLLNVYREQSGPLFKAITPKEIVFYNDKEFIPWLDEKGEVDYLKKSFVEQAKLNPILTSRLNRGSLILVGISASATAWSIATSKKDNKVEAAFHEGTVLLTSIGGGGMAACLALQPLLLSVGQRPPCVRLQLWQVHLH